MTKKLKTVYLPVFLVVLLVVVGGVYWYIDYSRYVSTDDAFVEFYTVTSAPKVMGRIVKLNFEEGDAVKEGDLLFEIDSTDLVAQLAHTKSIVSESEARSNEAVASYNLANEKINIMKIDVEKAKEDYERADLQYKGEVITKEAYDHAKKAMQVAEAKLKSAKKELDLVAASRKSVLAAVEAAKAQAKVLESKLAETRVYAPASGVVAKRWLLAGDIAQPGQSVYSIIENQDSWVKVYLEETKIAGIHEGSESKYTIDAYPDVTFEGKIYFIGPSTEAQFSLIPPNNASGNFTKVTQRIPVKISIDRVSNGKSLSSYPLLSGMSAVVKILRK